MPRLFEEGWKVVTYGQDFHFQEMEYIFVTPPNLIFEHQATFVKKRSSEIRLCLRY